MAGRDLEKLSLLRELGVAGSDAELSELLRLCSYNTEAALNRFYDTGLPAVSSCPPSLEPLPFMTSKAGYCSHGQGPDCRQCAMKQPARKPKSNVPLHGKLFLGKRLIVGIVTHRGASCRAGEAIEVRSPPPPHFPPND